MSNRLNNFYIQQSDSQSGVSLMLAILILAAVMAISFSLATIVIIEVRSSGDASRTEPTLYAAFGVTEEKLFQYKRFYSGASGDESSCAGSSSCEINGVDLTLPGTQPIAFDASPRVEYIPAGTIRSFPLFQSEPVSYDPLYSRVTVQVLPNVSSGSSVDFYFKATEEDGDSRTEPGLPLSADTTSATSFSGFGSGQYELVLDNSDSYEDVSVVIASTRVGNATPAGLPFIGEQVLRIRADYRGLNRTYQVRIPIP